MKEISEAGRQFIITLQEISNETVVVENIDDGVFSFRLSQQGLSIIYYLPGVPRKIEEINLQSSYKHIHVDEDRWVHQGSLIKNRLLVRLGKSRRVYGRLTVVARIDKKTTVEFQNEHHLQGSLAGKYRYGLFHKGELLAVAVFSGGRVMRHTTDYRSFECLSFCTKQGCAVIGGFGKLLQSFYNDFKPNDIMTYVDRDWSDGQKFETLGFQRIGITDPQLFLVEKATLKRIPATAYVLKEAGEHNSYDSDKFYKVFNSGSIKMIKYYPTHPVST